MESIIGFLKSEIGMAIGVSLFMLLEYWLGKTTLIKPGSTLEVILSGVKKVLEIIGFKKPVDHKSLK